MKIFLGVFIQLICIAALGQSTVYIPTHTIPKLIEPPNAYDVFSMHLIRQIHGTLFKINKDNMPEPSLVESFHVSSNRLVYTFNLSPRSFHRGQKMTPNIVKDSITRAIKAKILGYKQLKCVLGFNDLLSGKSKGLRGIVVSGPKKVTIHLNCPSPKLIYALSDIRYSIYIPRDPTNGLGSSRLVSINKDSVVLENANDPTRKFVIKKISGSKDVLRWERSRHVAFLQTKPPEALIGELAALPVYSLKNYGIGINPSRITTVADRLRVARVINREKLVKKCYPSQKISNQIVPFGFPGFDPTQTLMFPPSAIEKVSKIKEKREIALLRGIGNEECIKGYLAKIFPSSSIKIIESSVGVDRYIKNEIDIIFLYNEAELNIDMLQFYTGAEGYNLGDKNVSQIRELHNKLIKGDQGEYFKSAPKLVQKILDRATFIPLFSPSEFIYTSKDISPLATGVYSSTFFDYEDLKVKQ